ncbi:MAG TPA: formate dehydrogenase accessory sulfurtransferase FdhD [Acidimicrobiales bacterium]|nr:formate dehydrogenase accessory sulfurtransferase FdhD [Acidimicrobiales bacterium]
MSRRNVADVRVVALREGGRAVELPDRVVAEEPLEIRCAGPGQDAEPVTTTMRTPGHDFELAVGFLLAEGIINGTADVHEVKYCELPDDAEQLYNVVTVKLRRPGHFTPRRGITTASCGICGTAQLDELQDRCPVVPPGPPLPRSVLLQLPDRLREGQQLFDRTGGLHAAGLFDLDGTLLSIREDVGRHNAVDKLVGEAVLAGHLPLRERVLVVSGRVGYELVQKAAVAGIPMLAAVSAPSSLAVETGRRLGVCVAGFVRPPTANIYSHPERVDLDR